MGLTAQEAGAVRALRQRIDEALAAQRPGARVRCEATRALGYSLSFVFTREAADGPPEPLFAKIRRAAKFGAYDDVDDGGRAARLGRQEHDTLVQAHRWFERHMPGFGVVEPVLYLDDVNALVVRKAAGRALDTLVAEGHALALPAVVRCGRWLQAFHQHVHCPERHAFQAEAFLARFDAVVSALAEAGAAKGVTSRLRQRVVEQARRMDGAPYARTLLHGDLKMRHVWASPERLEVLDFGNVHHGPAGEDLAAFVVELEVLELGQRLRTRCTAGDMAAAFLDAYGDVDGPALFSLELVLARTKKWARRRARFSSSRRAVRLQRLLALTGVRRVAQRRYVDPWFSRRIEEELEWLERQPVAHRRGRLFTGRYARGVRHGFEDRPGGGRDA